MPFLTNWLGLKALPPVLDVYHTIPPPVLVANAFKSANVKPEASQMGSGFETEIVGH